MDPTPNAQPGPQPLPASTPGLLRWLLLILRVLGLTYIAALVLAYLFQEKLIFPGALLPHQELDPNGQTGLESIRLSAAGLSLHSVYGQALDPQGRILPDANSRPVVLYFYGNGMRLADNADFIERIRRLGFNLMAVDYPGYGASSGQPSEQGCRVAALAAYDYLVQTRGFEPARILILGWSLGGGVAIDLASIRPAGALAVCCTFTSMVDMARLRMPIFPVALLLRHRFKSLDKIRSIPIPILIGHGRKDSIVPFTMGEELAQAAGGPVETLWVADADHVDFFDYAGPDFDNALRRLSKRMAGG